MTSPFDGYAWVDLSHALEEDVPAYPTHARFGKALYESYEYGDVARHYGLTMSEHTGTHMDAPLHTVTFQWLMSPRTYAAMSPAQKKVIDDHCTTEWAGKFADP